MKLAEWAADGFEQGVVDFIAVRISDIGGSEQSALYTRDDQGLPRALVATDAALLDCRYGQDRSGRLIEVHVVSWDAVPVPWIVFAGFVTRTGVEAQRQTATVTLKIDPEFTGRYADPEMGAAMAFVTAVLRARQTSGH